MSIIELGLIAFGIYISYCFVMNAKSNSRYEAKNDKGVAKKIGGAEIVARNMADDYWYEVKFDDGDMMNGSNKYSDDNDKSFDSIEEAESAIRDFYNQTKFHL